MLEQVSARRAQEIRTCLHSGERRRPALGAVRRRLDARAVSDGYDIAVLGYPWEKTPPGFLALPTRPQSDFLDYKGVKRFLENGIPSCLSFRPSSVLRQQ